jgi:hypothetical protein
MGDNMTNKLDEQTAALTRLLEAKYDAAVAAIRKHNADCIGLCPASASKALHCPYLPMSKSGRCINCPMHWLISWPPAQEEEE